MGLGHWMHASQLSFCIKFGSPRSTLVKYVPNFQTPIFWAIFNLSFTVNIYIIWPSLFRNWTFQAIKPPSFWTFLKVFAKNPAIHNKIENLFGTLLLLWMSSSTIFEEKTPGRGWTNTELTSQSSYRKIGEGDF